MEEVRARIAGDNGWFDQHNKGVYELDRYLFKTESLAPLIQKL